MRTLVIGIPLPSATFDNYSFVSAPSISEYQRLVVETSAVARVVHEVADGTAEHRTFGGQQVVNAAAAADRFRLADLLDMRRREAEQFFKRGGTALVIAHPDAVIDNVEGAPGWRCYSWLPAPEGFRYGSDLLPGFGRQAAEALPVDNPFASYSKEFAEQFRYRVYAEDSTIDAAGGTVLARSSGGLAIAFDLPVAGGRIIITPPLADPSKDRHRAAESVLAAFDAIAADQPAEVPDWIRKEVP